MSKITELTTRVSVIAQASMMVYGFCLSGIHIKERGLS